MHAAPLASLNSSLATLLATLSSSGVDAERALAHRGSGELLRHNLWQSCHAAVSRGQKGRLRLHVVGGSMTAGHMNCLSSQHVMCVGRYRQPQRAWPRVLKETLKAALPNCSIELSLSVHPAASSATLFWEERLARLDADLVIEDYTINDVKGKRVAGGKLIDEVLLRRTMGAHEHLALAARGQRAALLMTETFPNFHVPLPCQPHLEFVHAAVARAYAVPVISFMRAVCNESAVATNSTSPARRHWRAGCGAFDLQGLGCMVHPGPYTHRLFGSLVAAYVLMQAVAAYTPHTRRAQPSEWDTPSGEGPFLLTKTDLLRMRACTNESIFSRWDSTADGCTVHRRLLPVAVGWSCYKDQPNKPAGWILNATAGVTTSTLSMTMRVSAAGYLVLGFLKSYEHMGTISVLVNENTSMAHDLDGRWDERTSQIDYVTIPMKALVYHSRSHPVLGSLHRPSKVTVQLRAPTLNNNASRSVANGKFKLMYIATC
ncbi:hypothetical protein AB1Y20_012593 [Prymnesium parvum]|uniref:Uncharacterized protein n=1 Tax=Prymnesium parvum TaxID=97485 RepID=A0AB34IKR1_PRYPA